MTPALAEMVDELRFASREALLRDIERAESLAGEIEPTLDYPTDWVVFRVTGYRPEMTDPPLIPGASLLGDLSAVVERLCGAAKLGQDDLGPAEPIDMLAARWSVSVRTLSRWRRRGLIARRVHDEHGAVRLVVAEHAAEAFAQRDPKGLRRAGGFSRIDDTTTARIVARARRYHDLLGLPMTQCAERLAARFGRSREAVRMLLARHDAEARTGKRGDAEPVFDPPRALGERTHRAIERAWRRGIEPAVMVRRYQRSRAGIHRIINEQRLARLRALDLGRTAPEARALDAADTAALLDAARAQRADPPSTPGDVTELLDMMRTHVVPVGVEERLWSKAEQALRARAARAVATIGTDFPEARLIDRAETDLRWAAALRAGLARPQLSLVLETLADIAGVDFAHVRAQDARVLIETGFAGLRAGLDGFDAWKAGRLAGTVGLTVARAAPRDSLTQQRSAASARVRIQHGTPAPDWTLLISPWTAYLRPDSRVPGILSELDPSMADMLADRYGLLGRTPQTLEEAASSRNLTVMQAGRLERNAARTALELARREPRRTD